uniref:Uncharacterized protein n=1 Tax=Arion vulgaris TaxID=1028688 RepID=A0A0B6ZIU6_9EUPU
MKDFVGMAIKLKPVIACFCDEMSRKNTNSTSNGPTVEIMRKWQLAEDFLSVYENQISPISPQE